MGSHSEKLTKSRIDALKPEDKPYYIWDTQTPGLAIKVLKSGRKKFVLKYRADGGGRSGRQRWYAIGTFGGITLHEARMIAQDLLTSIAKGNDPQQKKDKQRSAPLMKDLWDKFEKEHVPRRSKNTQRNYRIFWNKHIEPVLGTKKVHEVARKDVATLHHNMRHIPYQANRAVATLSKMFNLAEVWEMRPDGSNPCRHIEKNKEVKRQRYLNKEELTRLGEALRYGLETQEENHYMVGAVKLLLLTGARVSEILNTEWDWVDLEACVIRLPNSKTGPREIFLSPPAIEVIKHLRTLPKTKDQPFMIRGRFNGQPLDNLRKAWRRIRERAEIEDVRLHDLRHTAASIAAQHKYSLPIIGRVLGHTQSSTTQRYAHVDFEPALQAVDTIGSFVMDALDRKAPTNSDEPGITFNDNLPQTASMPRTCSSEALDGIRYVRIKLS